MDCRLFIVDCVFFYGNRRRLRWDVETATESVSLENIFSYFVEWNLMGRLIELPIPLWLRRVGTSF